MRENEYGGQDDTAHKIHVRDRIQREASVSVSGVIPELKRNEAMRDFVQDDRENKQHKQRDYLHSTILSIPTVKVNNMYVLIG